jgi:hypothetical protein
MRRRKALLAVISLLVLLGVTLGSIRIVAAMQGGNGDTEMTKSVARITYTGSYSGKSYTNKEICTGAVAGDDWILTALHCIFPLGNGAPSLHLAGLRVQLWRAGVTNIETPDYSSALSLDDKTYPPVVPMLGGLSGSTLYRDVALLHVATHMPTWAKTIPTAPSWPAIGTALTEYGYGDTSYHGTSADQLKKSQQGSIKRDNCPNGRSWSNGHLCITSSSSLPWEGDSGGPLLWWNNGYWQQVGSFSQFPDSVCPDGKKECKPEEKKRPKEEWRSYWSEADSDTRNWILSTVGANFASETILRDQASGTSWLYKEDGYRHWIPDGRTYNCLVNNGATVPPDPPSLRTIEALPDKVGSKSEWASCTSTPTKPSGGGSTPSNPKVILTQGPAVSSGVYRYAVTLSGFPANATVSVECYDSVSPSGFYHFSLATDASGNGFTQSQCYSGDGPDHWVVANGVTSNHVQWGGTTSKPPAKTYSETVGGNAHTWTDYSNAGGIEGPTIPAYQTVQIACKVTGFKVANGNTWWYRIASAPWSNTYYVSADAFYNNGATSGSLHGTPFVDPAVPDC